MLTLPEADVSPAIAAWSGPTASSGNGGHSILRVAANMASLEELTKGALVRGVLAERAVKVVDVTWHGASAVTLTYTDDLTGRADHELLYRDDEPRLIVEGTGRAGSMDADGQLFRLAS